MIETNCWLANYEQILDGTIIASIKVMINHNRGMHIYYSHAMARLAVGRYGEASGQRSDMIVSTMYIFLTEIVKSSK